MIREDLKELGLTALNLVDNVRNSKVGMAVEIGLTTAVMAPVAFAIGAKEEIRRIKKSKGIENEYVSNYEDDYRNIGLLTDTETL